MSRLVQILMLGGYDEQTRNYIVQEVASLESQLSEERERVKRLEESITTAYQEGYQAGRDNERKQWNDEFVFKKEVLRGGESGE